MGEGIGMGTSTITLEVDGQRFEVDSLWLRDEADFREPDGERLRDHVLALLADQLADEWEAAGPRAAPGRADDVQQLASFEQFLARVKAHDSLADLQVFTLRYHADERLVDAGFVQMTEAELELLERHLPR